MATRLERIDAEIDRIQRLKWRAQEYEAVKHVKREVSYEERRVGEVKRASWIYSAPEVPWGQVSGYQPDPRWVAVHRQRDCLHLDPRTTCLVRIQSADIPCTCETCSLVSERREFLAANQISL